jgi:hypothetical protein
VAASALIEQALARKAAPEEEMGDFKSEVQQPLQWMEVEG